MRKYINITTLCAALLFVGCTQDERPQMEAQITDMKIVVTPTEVPNVYRFTANPANVIGNWTLGNGAVATSASSIEGEYPFAGNYTVSLEAYGSGGKTNSVSIVLPVMTNNLDLLTDPYYALLTDGVGNNAGKTWVVDSMLNAYLVKSPTTGPTGDWATAPAGSASGNRMNPSMFDDEATFVLTPKDGPAFRYKNGGTCVISNTAGNFLLPIFMSNGAWQPVSASVSPGPYNSDQIVKCTPPNNMTWTLIKSGDGSYSIAFPPTKAGQGGFLFMFADWSSNYIIQSLTRDRLVVWKTTTPPTGSPSVRQLVMIKKGTPSGLPLGTLPETDSQTE